MTLPTARWRPLIGTVCTATPPVPPDWYEAMVMTESGGDPNARSASDARGLCQLIPRWHADGVGKQVAAMIGKPLTDALWYDPEFSLRAGALHLRWCYTSDGSQSWERAVRKYFSGSADPPASFQDGQGTTPDQHIAKLRAALDAVRADLTTPATPEPPAQETPPMATTYKQYTWPGLAKPVYLPDTLPASVQLIPGTVAGWTDWAAATHQTTYTQHFTGNMDSSAQSEHDWAAGGGRATIGSPGSYHLIVDGTEVIVALPFNRAAGHAANNTGNLTSFACEMAIRGGYEAAFQNAAHVAAAVIASKDWQVDTSLLQHWNWLRDNGTQKNCPSIIRDRGDWSRFVATVGRNVVAIRVFIAGIGAGGQIPAPTPIYAAPSVVPEIDAISTSNTIAPFFAVGGGTTWTWLGDRARVTTATGRYQFADLARGRVGADLKVGEELDIDWVTFYGSEQWGYTPMGTRIRMKDVERISDTKGAIAA